MTVCCPRCQTELREGEFPRVAGARLLCPGCGNPIELSAFTLPLDQGALSTLESRRVPGGSLADGKKYALVVLAGKQAGTIFAIEKARVTIGREGCDIVLDDPEISRQHALLAIQGLSAHLEDLGSTNGTFLDGNRIEEVQLEDRTEFRIGQHELVFVINDVDE